jgi:predicted SAM-dependent methyltransferase
MIHALRGLARRVRHAFVAAGFDRRSIADAYLEGRGIEVGALHRPLRVSPRARVTYVDRLWEHGLRQQYPELSAHRLTPVDVCDDGERLGRIADASQDFVIANHFLEHCQDPIGTLMNFLRVLRPGGVVYLAVPDHRYTFDRARPVTPLAHLLRDHERGPEGSRRPHFEEWTRLVNGVEDVGAVAEQVEHLMCVDYSIHYHVWSQAEFLGLLLLLRQRQGFEIELFLKRRYEMIAVLRKAAAVGRAAA